MMTSSTNWNNALSPKIPCANGTLFKNILTNAKATNKRKLKLIGFFLTSSKYVYDRVQGEKEHTREGRRVMLHLDSQRLQGKLTILV